MQPRGAVSSHESVHWGVDSWGPADRRVTVPAALRRAGEGEHSDITLLELVARRMGRAPAFWGRYLNRRLPQDQRTGEVRSPEHSHAITPHEVEFLHAQDCRALLVYNGSAGRGHRLSGGRGAGREAAGAADRLCEQLQVPRHVAIYADVENWPGDVGWFRGWFETMHGLGRKCGVYGRPIRVVENPASASPTYGAPLDRIESRHTRDEARRRIDFETHLGGSTPRRVTTQDFWSAQLGLALGEVLLDSVIEHGVDPFRGAGAAVFYVWSSEPRRVLGAEGDAQLGGSDIPQEFVPAQPPHASAVHTSVWQYLENAIHLGGRGAVDMNMADEAGYAAMW
jgi:Domain of unknown function (DUF1906)